MPKEIRLTDSNPYTQLTLMQKHYVEARLQGLSKSASCRACGHRTTSSHSMEHNPKVQAAIRYLIRESTASVEELTKSDVMTGMMDAVNAAATASELVMAWREIGKLLGAYEPERKILEIRDYTTDELKALSDKDLAKLAGPSLANVIEDAEFEEVG
ncbi:MAG: hypothetical protein E4H01_10405 [Lysobacterales bacterium]|nr:MAG: hypothetical protein E4H01_10405 [Xanthomonadales bacterium]